MSSAMRVLTILAILLLTVAANPLVTQTLPSTRNVVTDAYNHKTTRNAGQVFITVMSATKDDSEVPSKPPDNDEITSKAIKFSSETTAKGNEEVTKPAGPIVPVMNANVVVTSSVSTTESTTHAGEVYDAKKVRKFFTVTTLCGIGVIVAVIILCGILVLSINSRADDYVS